MGFLDFVKDKFRGSDQRTKNEESSVCLVTARNNLKLASDQLVKFLEDSKNFEPAMRHRELYVNEVLGKLKLIKGGIRSGLTFLDEKMGNEINTQNPIKNVGQLKQVVDEWIKSLNANDEKFYDVLRILQVEMWSEDKAKRGFPVPRNKEVICSYLTKAHEHLTEARTNLDNAMIISAAPESA